MPRKRKMNEPLSRPFLSEDEILFHRMESFHRTRVEEIAAGRSPLGTQDDGFLAVHLLPHSCFTSRRRFDGGSLKQHGATLSVVSEQSRYATSRFNVDGLLNLEGGKCPDSYSQILRDGRLEAVMTRIAFEPNRRFLNDDESVQKPRCLRYTMCERAVLTLAPAYLAFCKDIGIPEPVSLYSALIGCSEVRYCHDSPWLGEFTIDRSPAYLPDLELSATNGEPEQWLRPWCDTLAQSLGFDKSPNYDEHGKWREGRR
jgi:hypothetical protein